MKLLMYTGNGLPGPFDSSPNPGAMMIEGGVHELTRLFHARLDALGIAGFYDDYGPGTHTWPYWARDLRQSIGAVMASFASPPPTPSQVTYTSADPQYAVYGWTVRTHRAVREFSTLRSAGTAGFTLQGSGSAVVITPPIYRRGASYLVTIRTQNGASALLQRADGSCRLTLQVELGPSDTVPEYSIDGTSIGTAVYRTRVTIAPLAR